MPGWLTSFGSEILANLKVSKKQPDEKAIEAIFMKAVKEFEHDVKRFLQLSQSTRRYAALILALDRLGGNASWSELMKASSVILGEEIPGSRITELCERLLSVALISKENNKYKFPDLPTAKTLTNVAKSILS